MNGRNSKIYRVLIPKCRDKSLRALNNYSFSTKAQFNKKFSNDSFNKINFESPKYFEQKESIKKRKGNFKNLVFFKLEWC